MSIASAIELKQQQVEEAYTAVSNKGGTMPSVRNLTNLAEAIDSITGGGGTLITQEITENGIYRASTYGADGFSEVTVDVSGATLIETTFVENGTFYASAQGVDGFSEVTVELPVQTVIETTITANGMYYAQDEGAYGYYMVDVEVPEPLLVNKTILANGTYTASVDDNAYGYDTVIVDTPYQGYLDDIIDVLNDAGVTVTAGDYSNLATTIANSYADILAQLEELNNGGS